MGININGQKMGNPLYGPQDPSNPQDVQEAYDANIRNGHTPTDARQAAGGGVPTASNGPAPLGTKADKRYENNPFDVNSPNTDEQNQAREWIKQHDQALKDQAGAPHRPDFISQREDDGRIKEEYRINPGQLTVPSSQMGDVEGRFKSIGSLLPGLEDKFKGITVDPRALNAYRDRALQEGDSPWLKLQMEKQGLDEKNLLDQGARQSMGANAQAESQLAMRGGLSSGARERVARAGASDLLGMQQGARNQGALSRLGLRMQDDATKMDALGRLPEMELNAIRPELEKAQFLGNQASAEQANKYNAAQFLGNFGAQEQQRNLDAEKFNVTQNTDAQKYNVNAALNDILQKRAYDLSGYNEQMKAWAAGKTGDAVASSGGKK